MLHRTLTRNEKIVFLSVVFFIMVAFVFISECAAVPDKSSTREIVSPTDFGNGVLYFHTNGGTFGDSLSEYIKDHPDMRVVTIAPNTYGSGYQNGYFVIVEKRGS